MSEIDMSNELFPVVTIRDEVLRDFGVSPTQWYYHAGKFQTTEMSGWKWFTSQEVRKIRQFFAALGGRPKRRKANSQATGV